MVKRWTTFLLAFALCLVPFCSYAQSGVDTDTAKHNIEAYLKLLLSFPNEELFALSDSIPLDAENSPTSLLLIFPNWDEASPEYAQYTQAFKDLFSPYCSQESFDENSLKITLAGLHLQNRSFIESQATLQADKIEIIPDEVNPNRYNFTAHLLYSRASETKNLAYQGQADCNDAGLITQLQPEHSSTIDLQLLHTDYFTSQAIFDNISNYITESWHMPDEQLVQLFDQILLTTQDGVVSTQDVESPEYAAFIDALQMRYARFFSPEAEGVLDNLISLNSYHLHLARQGIRTSVKSIQIQLSDRIDEKFDFTFTISVIDQDQEREIEIAGEARLDQDGQIKHISLDEVQVRKDLFKTSD